MKLVMIMSVSEHAGKLNDLLVRHGIPAFSEMEMKGVKTGVAADEKENWFGHDRFEALSNLIFTAVDDAKAAELMRALKEFSDRHAAQNPIHALQLDVEHAV